jgi:GntR family transcriptional regulator, rspAB operon transcriptional repressor
MRSSPGQARHGAASAMDTLGTVQVKTLTEQAYQLLKDAIITLELRPGTPLSELQVANRLGISKSPVREALQRLSRDGLVTLEPNRRCVVTGVDESSVRDWYELRLMLEPQSLARVVDTITPETLEFLQEINRLAIEAVEQRQPLEFIHNSDLFHLTLIELNPNASLVAVVHDLFNKIRRVRIAQYQVDTLKEQQSVTLRGLHRHEEITAHLMRGESEQAVALLAHDTQRFIGLIDEGHISDALERLAYS